MRGELVDAGSTVVVGAMDTDAWPAARARVARLFGRGRPKRQARYEAQLDDSAAQVAEAGGSAEVRDGLVGAWRLELQALLHRHPDAAAELQAVVTQLKDTLPAAQQNWMRAHLDRQQASH